MADASVYLDTNAIIAIMESPPSDGAGIQDFWKQQSDRKPTRFHTSELSLAELLVIPYRSADTALVEFYLQLFSDQDILAVHGVNRPILDVAAVIRSRRRMKLPDAIHLATASVAKCSYFVTFDTGIADLGADHHPFLEDVALSPVQVVHADEASLLELSKALS